MQFWRAKLWIIAALIALCGPFSPVVACLCSPATAAPQCQQKIESCVKPCGQCCRPVAVNAALFGVFSAPLPNSSSHQWSHPAPEASHSPAVLVVPFALEAPTFQLSERRDEIDLPPPRQIFGSSFSCRAPPLR